MKDLPEYYGDIFTPISIMPAPGGMRAVYWKEGVAEPIIEKIVALVLWDQTHVGYRAGAEVSSEPRPRCIEGVTEFAIQNRVTRPASKDEDRGMFVGYLMPGEDFQGSNAEDVYKGVSTSRP